MVLIRALRNLHSTDIHLAIDEVRDIPQSAVDAFGADVEKIEDKSDKPSREPKKMKVKQATVKSSDVEQK